MNVQSLVNQVESLFSLPEVALRVNEVLNSSEPSNAELEAIIINDPALTAKILKIVNSSYFGFPATIDTVSRAITIIGLKELRNLVFTTSVTTTFKGIPTELIDMDVFWYHSVTSALLAKMLAKRLKYADYERMFIAGLLHSVGRLIYFTQCPEIAREILNIKDQGEDAMILAEQEKLGFTYAELGAELLKHWKLPENIWQLISHHLDPLNARQFKEDTCVLHVASKIAGSVEPCAKYDFDVDEIEPNFDQGVLEYLQLSPNQMQYCIDEVLFQANEVMFIINPKSSMIF